MTVVNDPNRVLQSSHPDTNPLSRWLFSCISHPAVHIHMKKKQQDGKVIWRQASARKGLNSTSGTQFAALPLVSPVVWFARAVVNRRSRSVAKSAYFQPRIAPPFCFEIPNPALQIGQIPTFPNSENQLGTLLGILNSECFKKEKQNVFSLRWFSHRTGTSVDDGKARGKDWTRLPVPNLPLYHRSSQFSNSCKPEEAWYGQPKYYYKKNITLCYDQLKFVVLFGLVVFCS